MNIKNKKIYIYPYSSLTTKLLEELQDKSIIFKGFIDKSKVGTSIFKLSDIEEYDYILVCSPNHASSILKDLKNHKTILVHYFDNKFYINKIPYLSILKHKVILFWKDYVLNKQYKIKSLKNRYATRRAFVIGNGPSLNVEDIDKIRDELTFAANKIWLLFDKTSWRPTCYSVTDRLVMSQNEKRINSVECNIKLFPDFLLPFSKKRIKNSIYFKSNHDDNFNLGKGIYTGPTVLYALISYAIYMGIKEIYLIGVDHNFSIPKKYQNFKKGDDNTIVSEGEVNHFHKDYRKKGEKWSQPELDTITNGFTKIKKLASEYNVKIYNASRYSELEVFEMVNLDDILGKVNNGNN